ncbi:MAG: TIGR03619 family F420-dependent LLM class oxidoreductase [Gammaproteobacteria bacterium]|nr:TIGR03619 family F420-dependent LLM class oxidoreductase [Gammaproteobacteria bacterium]
MREGAIVQLGVTLRNMGPQSTAALMRECAICAETAGIESLWITDHIAIPPDDAEGSDGRYVDPLTTLAWMAGFTRQIKLGVAVMVLPYRAPLPFAKSVAAVQELSEDRLLLGVGVGWMAAEFRALGIPRNERGRRTDDTLEFLGRCFEDDVVVANDQPFLFKPRPAKPAVLVGGRAPHALRRAARFGDGWLPMGATPGQLASPIAQYRSLTDSLGRAPGTVTVLTPLDVSQPLRARQLLSDYEGVGVSRVIAAIRYDDLETYRDSVQQLSQLR